MAPVTLETFALSLVTVLFCVLAAYIATLAQQKTKILAASLLWFLVEMLLIIAVGALVLWLRYDSISAVQQEIGSTSNYAKATSLWLAGGASMVAEFCKFSLVKRFYTRFSNDQATPLVPSVALLMICFGMFLIFILVAQQLTKGWSALSALKTVHDLLPSMQFDILTGLVYVILLRSGKSGTVQWLGALVAMSAINFGFNQFLAKHFTTVGTKLLYLGPLPVGTILLIVVAAAASWMLHQKLERSEGAPGLFK
jgi:hypothetical protein